MLSQGKTAQLLCMPVPYYAELSEVVWTSSDPDVATVDGGRVVAVSEGTAVVTAAAGEISVSCAVTVSQFSGEMYLYDMASSYQWIGLDAAAPQDAQVVENATNSYNGFTAAAYRNGWIYGYDLCVERRHLSGSGQSGQRSDPASAAVGQQYLRTSHRWYGHRLRRQFLPGGSGPGHL